MQHWRWSAEEAPNGSKFRSARCDRHKKVRPHHTGTAQPPLSSHPAANTVQARHCSLQVADDCILVSAVAGWRHLRLADTMKLSAQRTIKRTVVGTRAFAVSAAVIWNILPAELRLTYVVHPDILGEAENFLRQLDNVTASHLRTV